MLLGQILRNTKSHPISNPLSNSSVNNFLPAGNKKSPPLMGGDLQLSSRTVSHAPVCLGGGVAARRSAQWNKDGAIRVIVARHRATTAGLALFVEFQLVFLTKRAHHKVIDLGAAGNDAIGVEIVGESTARRLAGLRPPITRPTSNLAAQDSFGFPRIETALGQKTGTRGPRGITTSGIGIRSVFRELLGVKLVSVVHD